MTTNFKPPVPATMTPYAELNIFIKNIQNYLTQLSTDLNTAFVPQMSETPQQIGTWIDGSPIYRKAFDVLLKDMDAADYADILSNRVFTEFMNESGYLISVFCACDGANGTLYYCGIDVFNDTAVDFVIPFGMTIPEDQSDCTTERYYGYIDFIQTGDAE